MARIITERCICDRCGKEYITNPFWQGFPIIKIQQRSCIRITYKTMRATDDNRGWTRQVTKELCEDCMRSLNEWFAKGKEGEG